MVRERDDGPPVDQRFALIHRSQYEIIDTWHAVGLSGTGSKDVAVKNLFVPDIRTISAWSMNGKPHPGSAVNTSPLFRLPMLALGPYVLSGVLLGCAQGAYETVVGAARKRNATTTGQPFGASQAVQIKVAEASVRIDTAEVMMSARLRARHGGGPIRRRRRRTRTSCATGATRSSRPASVSRPSTS